MKELSLNILDIAMNSVKAGAKNVDITIDEQGPELNLTIRDDGCGMSPEQLEEVTNPFFTTRTTRKVGMGVPLLKLAAEQTGGKLTVTSRQGEENHGTETKALFYTDHIDFTPLGDIVSSICTLIQGSPAIDWHFVHGRDGKTVELDTKELRQVLGDVPLDSYEVIKWIEDYLKEGYSSI